MAERDILADAREQFKQASDAASENREDALDDLRFARMGEQWDDKIRKQREREGRPCLTINRLPAFARQVVNECRQNRPSIIVHPASDEADVKTAEVLTGLIRNIEACSDADVAYDTAVESAIYGGFGYFRVDLDYSDNDTFDMDLRICRIANPFTVYADPMSQAADSSDWSFAFVTELQKIEDFKRKYPDAKVSDFEEGDEEMSEWFTDDAIRVAEWWKREEVSQALVKLSDGTILRAEQYVAQKQWFDAAGLQVVGERDSRSFKVTQRLITGAEVLDEKEWAGKYIPVVPVYGEEVNLEGERYFRSLIRDARDPQQMLNFWRSASTEMVALAPRVPFIGPRGAFMTDSEKWANINRKSYSHVEYDGPTPPQRQPLDTGAAAGALQEAMNATDDLKSIMGIYDATLGAKGNETSGVAIARRTRQTDISTFHFADNLNRAVRHCGRILVDMIPTVYTPGRVIRILGEDGTPSQVPLGQPVQMPAQGAMPSQGMPQQHAGPTPQQQAITHIFDPTVGKYDVVVKAGPSYGTRRQEAADQQLQFITAVPQVGPMMMDIVASNLDWPQADKLKARLEQQMANPPPNPEIIKAQAQGQLEQTKAQINAQLEQMKAKSTQEIEAIKAQAEVQKAQAMSVVDTEKAKQQALIDSQKAAQDNATKMRIESEKIASAERIKAAELAAQRQNKMLELAAGILSARSGVRGQNITNDSTLDQTGAGATSQGGIQSVMGDIESAASVVESIVGGSRPKKKPRKAIFTKIADGKFHAQELDDDETIQ